MKVEDLEESINLTQLTGGTLLSSVNVIVLVEQARCALYSLAF